MKFLVGLVIFFVVVFDVLAQDLPYFLMRDGEVFDKQLYREQLHKHDYQIQKEYVPLETRNYDVLRYDLFLDWYDLMSKTVNLNTVEYRGVNTILVEITEENVEQIEFDAFMLDVNSLQINDEVYEDFSSNFGSIRIDFDNPLNNGETLKVEIDYNYSSNDVDEGVIFHDKGEPVELGPPPDRDTIFTEERIAYTMSEPIDARKWMPCNDNPYDKALSSTTVRVPSGFIVASNGLLDTIITEGEADTFYWSNNHPITTYLMEITVSKYAYYYNWYKRVTNPNDSIKVEYYVWQADYDDTTTTGLNYNARYAFRNTVAMMEHFSTHFGEYPFDKYGQTAVQPAWFGGMEHQSITTQNRSILRVINRWGQNRDYSNQSVIAHELAHQWIGDYITCASWNDIWINEGGAVWGEAVWDMRNGDNSYYQNILSEMYTFLWYDGRSSQPPIYGPDISNVFNYATTYAKSGVFYHMLSEALGRDRFLEILRALMEHYAYQSIDTEQFKEFFKSQYPEDSPVNFDEFFEQWIYKAGYPIFWTEVVSEPIQDSETYSVDLELEQSQEGFDVPNVFRVPLWLTFLGPEGEIHKDSIYTQERIETHNFILPFMPDSIEIDYRKTLCEVNPEIVSVRQLKDDNPINVNIYPNPIYGAATGKLSLNIYGTDLVQIEIYDELGRFISSEYNSVLYPGSYEFELNTHRLISGNYFVKITHGVNYKFEKFTKLW